MTGLFMIGCSSEDSEAENAQRCARMRDHLVELRLADTTAIDRDAHRAVMQSALGEDFISRCAKKITAGQVDCVLEAGSTENVRSCSRISPQ